MVGIRIRHLPEQCQEKLLKIYFSKPEYGGGRIEKIYFPLMNNDAVVIFEDKRVLQTITRYQHEMAGYDLEIEVLPEHMIFTTMEAKLDMSASVILQVSQKLRDEMEFSENIKVIENEDQTYSLKGNWFQLEWAWHYLDFYMKHQEVIESQIEQTSSPQSHAVAMEIDDNIEEKWKTYRVRTTSPTEVNTAFRKNFAERAKNKEAWVRSSSSPMQSMGGDFNETDRSKDERSMGQGHISTGADRRTSRDEAYSKSIGSPHESLRESSSPHTSLRRSPSQQAQGTSNSQSRNEGQGTIEGTLHSKNEGTSLSGLKDNINHSYGASFANYSSMNRANTWMDPDDFDTDDEIDDLGRSLAQEHKVPFESVHSSLGIGNQERKSDQNRTFEEFSAPYSSISKHQAYGSLQRSGGDFKADSSLTSDRNERLRTDTTPTKRSHLDSKGKDPALASSRLDSLKGASLYGATASTRTSTDSRFKLDALRTQSSLPDRYSEEQLHSKFRIRNVTVTVYFGDLLQENTEAIVNAANFDLDHMGGIAYAISLARGPELARECRKYIRDHGNLKVSEVTHTSGGGKLKALHIIHAHGPMWSGEQSREKSSNQLRDTFLNCFVYAETKLWLRSLSTPAISTGVFGVPLDICVRSFLDAVLIFSNKHKDCQLTDIRLVSNDAVSTVTAIVLLQTLLDTGIDSLTEEAMNTYQQFTEKSKMNLPRGRPEQTDFSKSYLSTGSSDVRRSNVRRSSSSSRVFDRKREEEEPIKKYDTKTNTYVEKDTEGSTRLDRGRPRTNSVSGTKSQRSGDLSARKTSGDKPYLSAVSSKSSKSPRVDSPSSQSSVESSRKVPLIKGSLLSSSSKITTRKPGSTLSSRDPTKSRASAVKATDDRRSHVSAESNYRDDTYSYKSTGRSYTHDEDDFGLHSLPLNLAGSHQDSSYREKFLQLQADDTPDEKVSLCAICLDKVRRPKKLPKCGHTFCTECIGEYFSAAQPKCPTCGTLYGRIRGDQPKGGNMTYTTDRRLTIPGYEREDGAIVINYTFPGGIQEPHHPNPGRSYKGLSRKAYLPNSAEGREVLRLLKKSFQANLTFTIGDSRTSGEPGVITWNDIHHKTSVTGGSTKFGYPDLSYLRRVKEELASKGIVS